MQNIYNDHILHLPFDVLNVDTKSVATDSFRWDKPHYGCKTILSACPPPYILHIMIAAAAVFLTDTIFAEQQ